MSVAAEPASACLIAYFAWLDLRRLLIFEMYFLFLLILVVRVLDFDFQCFHLFSFSGRQGMPKKKQVKRKWLFGGGSKYWVRKGNKEYESPTPEDSGG